MKPLPAHRAGRPQPTAPAHLSAASAPVHHAPNAALLIDFDNVTLGVRSDLAKELRTLLNSDIVKGKVSVQRAYADWRRYPQYIVSLSESSIDLIFAPAFGTNKKNATDIRLAVDAIELVFTRPEIGTFILLSGDSDFSSLVLKLKEYGKYVIGVGIRESASDILIQNCDEYYSYSDLAGLSKEADVAGPPRDPWELVVAALAQMTQNRDVMRADRLKQVMQQMDPSFDEAESGFNRFSKFVTEAGTRGLIRVIKQDNGQLEVAPLLATAAAVAPAATQPARGAKPTATPSIAAPAAEGEEHPSRRRRGGRGRGRGGSSSDAPVSTPVATESAAPAPRVHSLPPSVRAANLMTGLTLAEAFHLMVRALGELPAPVADETLRARMAALHGKEDPLIDTSRFSKLLRQANDAEIADVRMIGENKFEISQHKTDLALQMRPAPEAPRSSDGAAAPAASSAPALRFRGTARTSARPPALQMVGMINLNGDTPSAPVAAAPVAAPAAPAAATPAAATRAVAAPAVAPPASSKPAAKGRGKPAPKTAPKPAATKPAASAKAAAKPAAKVAAKPAPKGKKASKPKSSKPRGG